MLLLCWWRNLLVWLGGVFNNVFLVIFVVSIWAKSITIIIVNIIPLPPPSSSPQTVSPQHSPLLNYFTLITFYYFPTPNHTSPTTTLPFTYKSSHTDSTSNYTSLRIDASYPSTKRYSSLSTLSSSDC